jgi:hypothetical protein
MLLRVPIIVYLECRAHEVPLDGSNVILIEAGILVLEVFVELYFAMRISLNTNQEDLLSLFLPNLVDMRQRTQFLFIHYICIPDDLEVLVGFEGLEVLVLLSLILLVNGVQEGRIDCYHVLLHFELYEVRPQDFKGDVVLGC